MAQRIQIKIFEHVHLYTEEEHFLDIQNQMNTFLLTLNPEDVIGVGYDYLPLGNLGRNLSQQSRQTTRCIGLVSYKVVV